MNLSGCLFAYDGRITTVDYKNDYAEPVLVFIEGSSPEYGTQVKSQSSNAYPLQGCFGDGLRVETESGVVLGRVDEQACPDWLLTINEDGSLTYEEITY